MAILRAVVVAGDRSRGKRRVQVLFGSHALIEMTADDGHVLLLLGAHDRGFESTISKR